MGNINDTLRKMRMAGKISDMKSKGDLGEDAVLAICADRKNTVGQGILYQSYMYPYQTDRSGRCYTGNVKYENKKFVEYTKDSLNDEIDVLYITPYRIFPIEVKSYHARTIEVYRHWSGKDSKPFEKSPIAQAEKHARHLYHLLYDVIPDGKPAYIQPMVCFVDRCELRDDRDQVDFDYIPACIINNFLSTLNHYNTPLEYNLDLSAIERKLNESKVSIKRSL